MRIILLATLLAPACLADTIQLTDGTKIEGKVISEQGDNFTVQVQVTRSIRDERVISKSKIKQIIKDAPDLAAFDAISAFANIPDLLPLKEYDSRIAAVEKFLKTYPEGSKRTEAKNILAKLQPERDAIATGSIKFGGKLISTSEKAADAYDIDAKILAAEIKRLAQSDQIIPALRKFDEFDKCFSGSAVYTAALPFHLGMLQSFQSRIAATAEAQPKLSKDRESGFAAMPDTDRKRAIQIVKDEDEEYAKRLAIEHAANEKWLSIDPYHKEVLADTARNLQQEIQRLTNYKAATTAEPGEVFRNSWKTLMSATDPKAATAAIQAAQNARLPERYLKLLKQAQHN